MMFDGILGIGMKTNSAKHFIVPFIVFDSLTFGNDADTPK